MISFEAEEHTVTKTFTELRGTITNRSSSVRPYVPFIPKEKISGDTG